MLSIPRHRGQCMQGSSRCLSFFRSVQGWAPTAGLRFPTVLSRAGQYGLEGRVQGDSCKQPPPVEAGSQQMPRYDSQAGCDSLHGRPAQGPVAVRVGAHGARRRADPGPHGQRSTSHRAAIVASASARYEQGGHAKDKAEHLSVPIWYRKDFASQVRQLLQQL